MSAKTPIRTVFNDSNVATGLAEFQTGEFIPLSHGGIGAALSIGSAGQVLKVNTGGTALEFGAVEAIVNIDGATDLTSQTLVATDKLLVSDGGTEGRINLSQIDTLFTGTTQTLTNKTISGSSNTLSNIGNSSLTNSSVSFGGISLSLGASDATPAFDLSDATNYPTSSLTGTITNAQLAGSIANAKLSNSTITIKDDSSTTDAVSLGEVLTFEGGSGITTTVTDNKVSIATDGAVVTETSTDTLTNKTISGSSNTLSNIGNSSLTNSSINFGGVSLALGASDATPAFDLQDATNYPTSSLTGTITNAQLAGSIANAKLSNSSVTIGSTSISLGASSTTIAGITNLTAGGINITGNSITSADSTRIEMGEGLDITGTLTVSSNVDISGNLTVSGTTTSLETTNTAVTDNLLELNRGATNNTDDSGIIVERGSAGDNAILMWDESGDKFVVGTTTATADSNGNISHTKADFEAAEIKGSSGNFVSTGISAVMTVTGTDDGAGEGPDIVIKRNSASPADDDILGALVFKGENSADEAVTYGKVRAKALDVTDSTEDGQLQFSTIVNGSIANVASLDSTGLYLNQNLNIIFEGDGADAHELTLAPAAGLSGDVTVTLPGATDTLVGRATTDTLTNKSIDSDNNTITNIVNADIKSGAAIDASKIHDGTISNTEFGHLNGVSGNIQTQIDSKTTPAFAIAQAVALG